MTLYISSIFLLLISFFELKAQRRQNLLSSEAITIFQFLPKQNKLKQEEIYILYWGMACRSSSVSYIMASFNLPCCISISRFSPPLTFIPHKEISSTLFCGRKLASSSNHHFARRSCGKSDISEQYQYPPPQDALLLKAIAGIYNIYIWRRNKL